MTEALAAPFWHFVTVAKSVDVPLLSTGSITMKSAVAVRLFDQSFQLSMGVTEVLLLCAVLWQFAHRATKSGLGFSSPSCSERWANLSTPISALLMAGSSCEVE